MCLSSFNSIKKINFHKINVGGRNMPKINVIKPSYYDTFQCIGGTCRQSCCSNWNITLSKEEFKKTKKALKSDMIKEIFSDAFVPTSGNSLQKTNTYKMKLKENGDCPFLDEQRLCWIYKDCGPEIMSKTCRIFPRFNMLYDRTRLDCSLTLGCEEVVRLLLEEKEGFLLQTEEKDISFEELSDYENMPSLLFVKKPILKEYYTIRGLVLGILQNREYDMGERMILLGIALQKVHNMEKEEKLEEIPQYINNFLQNMNKIQNKNVYQQFFENIQGHSRLRALNTLTKYYSIWNLNQLRKDIRTNILTRIDADMKFQASQQQKKEDQEVIFDKVKYHFDGEKYAEAEEYFKNWTNKNPHVLENIIVSLAWQKKIPFAYGKDIWKNYCAFAVMYSIFRFNLAMFITKDTTEEEIIDCIVTTARSILHNDENTKKLEDELEDNESNTLAHMAMLVL